MRTKMGGGGDDSGKKIKKLSIKPKNLLFFPQNN